MINTNTALILISENLAFAQNEYIKFASGNGASSTRARKALQEIIANAKICRTLIAQEKNERKATKLAAKAE
jgi:hypothetical protein